MGLLDLLKQFAYGQEEEEDQVATNPAQLNTAPSVPVQTQTQLPSQFTPSAPVSKSGVQSIIEQNMATDPEPFVPEEQATPGGEKKGFNAKSLLPLLFRFGLPAVAGGVLGAKHPMGAAGGALAGLTHGGFGYMKDQNLQKAMDLKGDQAASKNALGQAKFGLEQDKANTMSDYKDRMASVAEQNASTKSKTALGKEDKILQFLSNQFGGQPMSEDNMDTFASSLATQMKPGELEVTEKGIFGDDTVQDETLVKQWMNAYNKFLDRGGKKSSSTPSGNTGGTQKTSSGLSYTIQ